MLKGAVAPILMGCGILVLNPPIWGNWSYWSVMVVLSAVLCLAALVYEAFYVNKLWVKKEYRLITKSIGLMIISIVLCTVIAILISLYNPFSHNAVC